MNYLNSLLKKSKAELCTTSYYNYLNKGFDSLNKCCKIENFKKADEIYNNLNDHSDLYNISGKNNNREYIKRIINERNTSIREILNKIFRKYKNNINIIKWLFSLDIKPCSNEYINIIKIACAEGSLDLIKLLYPLFSKYNKSELNINYNKLDEVCFTIAVEYGQLEVVQWLYEVIYIDDCNFIDSAFISACDKPKICECFKYCNISVDIKVNENNKLEIIKWLYSLDNKYDIHINNDKLFITACVNEYLEIAKWIYSLDDKHENMLNLAFNSTCRSNKLEIAKWLYSLDNKIDIHYNNDENFITACVNEYLEIAKWIYSLDDKHKNMLNLAFNSTCCSDRLEIAKWLYSLDNKIDIHYNNDEIFITICKVGFLDIAKWLYSLDDKHENISLAFNNACYSNQLEIAKWLYSLDNKLDINEFIFIYAVNNNRINLAKWLVSICNDYSIEIEIKKVYIEYSYEYIKNYYIKNSLEELIENKDYNKIIEKLKIQIKEFTINEEDKCCICFESNYNFLSSCNHCFCLDCFLMWKLIDINNKCAYCNKDIEIQKCCVLKKVD